MQVWHTVEVFPLPAGNGEITFLITDNKNRVLTGIDKDGVCSGCLHTKLKIRIIVHGTLLPTDILHHPRGQL